ncbi:hypothetical protein [Brevundimonas diminuta]|uniref:hypothetical protein n=1 Tax=Brevundimonas diminuta TaxID=293 RepID=UPI0025A55F83|nr:hypothetical protein [Brevundimonas diminuta]MDM8352854.1 hypothetical protein [Brevundimonas diminuta]
MTTPRVTVPVEPTALSVCRAIAPYLGATDLNDWSGLEDDDAISMPVKMRVGDLRDLKAVISAAPAPEGGAVSETELRDAIALILPMAKGYAAAHPVGSNQSYVDYVENLITTREEAPAEAGETIEARFPELNDDLIRMASTGNTGSLIEWGRFIERLQSALHAQPPAREDAQPVDASWHYTKDCPAPDALRVAVEALEAITDLSVNLRQGGPDSSDLNDLSDALNTAVDVAHEALAALQAEQKGGA